jgi:hypothetical protein
VLPRLLISSCLAALQGRFFFLRLKIEMPAQGGQLYFYYFYHCGFGSTATQRAWIIVVVFAHASSPPHLTTLQS